MIIWNKYRCAITIDDIGYHGGRMLPQDMLQVCSWWMSTHTFILCCSWWSPLLQGPLRSALHGKGNLQPCPCISCTQEIKFHTSWTGRVKPRGRSCCGGGKARRAILNKAHHVFLHCYLFKLPGLLWVFMLLNIIAGLCSKFVFGFDYLCYRCLATGYWIAIVFTNSSSCNLILLATGYKWKTQILGTSINIYWSQLFAQMACVFYGCQSFNSLPCKFTFQLQLAPLKM